MANLVESPDGVSRAAIGDPLTADKLADPALQDAQLMFQAARREARIGPNLRRGFRRQLGPKTPGRGLRDEPRVDPQQEQEPKNRGRVQRPVVRPTAAPRRAGTGRGRLPPRRPPGLGRGPHRRRPRWLGGVGPRPRPRGAVAEEERGPPVPRGGGAGEEPARGGRLGRAHQVPRGVDASEAYLAGAVGVLAATGVVAAVPRSRARRPLHDGGRRCPCGSGGGRVGVGGARGRHAGAARHGGRPAGGGRPPGRPRRRIHLPPVVHGLVGCLLVGWWGWVSWVGIGVIRWPDEGFEI